jgi:hypothetical protein
MCLGCRMFVLTALSWCLTCVHRTVLRVRGGVDVPRRLRMPAGVAHNGTACYGPWWFRLRPGMALHHELAGVRCRHPFEMTCASFYFSCFAWLGQTCFISRVRSCCASLGTRVPVVPQTAPLPSARQGDSAGGERGNVHRAPTRVRQVRVARHQRRALQASTV